MQSERIRMWVARNGYQLVSICQDSRSVDAASERDGFGALLGILAARQADMVLVPTLDALSADKMAQEVTLFELRSRSIAVASTEEQDLDALAEPATDPARIFIRDTLSKSAEFRASYEATLGSAVEPPEADVVVEIVEMARSIAPVPDLAPPEEKATA